MSDSFPLKLVEAFGLLAAGGLFVWWQLRDVRKAQARTRAEREAAQRGDAAKAAETASSEEAPP